ncbi:MAG TPA: hypothetical protein VKA34_04785 [Balneolales bacterium]|nr:hypothetical protein [Balneolales bacterium]
MRRVKQYFISIFLLFLFMGLNSTTMAQSIHMGSFMKMDGYLKELGSLNFDNGFNTFHYDNLVHNRINTHWTITPNWTAQADLRTRFFYGYSVSHVPGFAQLESKDNGLVNLSWNLINTHRYLLNTQIDRLYSTYYTNNWELDVGRQRINWGRTLVWNPNDLFNAYSYLDFDYEERPGTDAIRFQYFTGFASGYEVAFKPERNLKQSIGAFLAKEHVGEYDIQGLAGYYKNYLAVGGGWAGPIKDAGFKGEFTYFQSLSNVNDDFLVASTSLDYSFPNSLYLYSEFLFNGNWHNYMNPAIILQSSLSPTNLFIARTAIFGEVRYPITPIITATLSGITSTSKKLVILIPQVSVSVTNNIDFLVLAQILRNKPLEQVLNTPNILYGRIKWSF